MASEAPPYRQGLSAPVDFDVCQEKNMKHQQTQRIVSLLSVLGSLVLAAPGWCAPPPESPLHWDTLDRTPFDATTLDIIAGATKVIVSRDRSTVGWARNRILHEYQPDPGKRWIARLSQLLLMNRLYTANADSWDEFGPTTPTPLLVFQFWTDSHYLMEVKVSPATHLMQFRWNKKPPSTSRIVTVNFDAIGPGLYTLLREAFPKSLDIQALTLTASPKAPISQRIPNEIRQQIQTIRPGMTRADLLKVFETEGGISARYRRTYVYRGGSSSSNRIKIDVTFAPGVDDVLWSDGKGLVLASTTNKSGGDFRERPDDIITQISAPYSGLAICD
jgi:hypothetical protein